MKTERWDYASQKSQRTARTASTGQRIGLLLALGIVVGLAAVAITSMVYKNSLQTRIHTIAEAVGSQPVSTLAGTGSDADIQSQYHYVKDKLARIKEANADVRFTYLMARDTDGDVYFLADSEREGSPSYSARGEPYPEASPALKAMFDNGQLLVEGPSHDSYGTWLSALAPVIDEQSYRLTAVVGMDVPATTYGLLLGLSGGVPLLLSVLAAVFVYIRHQSRKRRREHVQFRAEMISIASHELRTPLTGMRWSVESLLSNKIPAAKQHRTLEIMYDSTMRLEESIEDILQLASLESGKAQRLYQKETNLRDMLDDILAMQQLAADRHNIALTYGANWPKELLLECDAQRMKRVFHNIISNAVKYSQPDSVITIGYYHQETGKHVISVQDQGIGIPAAEQSEVWDGFYRATNTDAHDIHGTGMGLYLSRTIIEQHGGTMWLESKEGRGTTVFIEMPDNHNQTAPVVGLQTRG